MAQTCGRFCKAGKELNRVCGNGEPRISQHLSLDESKIVTMKIQIELLWLSEKCSPEFAFVWLSPPSPLTSDLSDVGVKRAIFEHFKQIHMIQSAQLYMLLSSMENNYERTSNSSDISFSLICGHWRMRVEDNRALTV